MCSYIQKLPNAPSGYRWPSTFSWDGVIPTYKNATKYSNCGGNCYTTSAARINKAYLDLYGVTPVDYSRNAAGGISTEDYKTASTQVGCKNLVYGFGGALELGGEGRLVEDAGVWSGQLKPGAAIQIWHSRDLTKLTNNGGHSQIFLNYTYEKNGDIKGMNIFDNAAGPRERIKSEDQIRETIKGTNLNDIKIKQ